MDKQKITSSSFSNFEKFDDEYKQKVRQNGLSGDINNQEPIEGRIAEISNNIKEEKAKNNELRNLQSLDVITPFVDGSAERNRIRQLGDYNKRAFEIKSLQAEKDALQKQYTRIHKASCYEVIEWIKTKVDKYIENKIKAKETQYEETDVVKTLREAHKVVKDEIKGDPRQTLASMEENFKKHAHNGIKIDTCTGIKEALNKIEMARMEIERFATSVRLTTSLTDRQINEAFQKVIDNNKEGIDKLPITVRTALEGFKVHEQTWTSIMDETSEITLPWRQKEEIAAKGARKQHETEKTERKEETEKEQEIQAKTAFKATQQKRKGQTGESSERVCLPQHGKSRVLQIRQQLRLHPQHGRIDRRQTSIDGQKHERQQQKQIQQQGSERQRQRHRGHR